MGARHRARASTIQIMRVEEVEASKTRRPNIKQFHVSTFKLNSPDYLECQISKQWFRRKYRLWVCFRITSLRQFQESQLSRNMEKTDQGLPNLLRHVLAKLLKQTSINVTSLSSPLVVQGDIAVTIFVRCMCVCVLSVCFRLSICPDLFRPYLIHLCIAFKIIWNTDICIL